MSIQSEVVDPQQESLYMPSMEILIAFILATAVFAYMPGPATLYAAAQTIARGWRAGWRFCSRQSRLCL
ncbi:MAG: hypothetical protein ACPGGK_01905 [Pikeienuella sp.]